MFYSLKSIKRWNKFFLKGLIYGNNDIAKMAIEKGANVNIKNHFLLKNENVYEFMAKHPLYKASLCGRLEVNKIFIEK